MTDRDLEIPKGQEWDTATTWMNPGSCLILRKLTDGRYVLYRVDAPAQKVLLFEDEIPMMKDLFSKV